MSGAGAVVVGGGIAGMSVAAELAALGVERPVLLEAEAELAHHTTGRSAASYIPGHGSGPMRALVAASRDRFDQLADEAGHSFLRPRPVLHVATTPEEERVLRSDLLALAEVTELSPADAVRRWPALRRDAVRGAGVVEDAHDADPLGLHQHYRQRFRAAGGEIRTKAPVVGMTRTGTGWHLDLPDNGLDTDLVVLAAGAWTDRLLALAGAPTLGLQAMRRTIAIVRAEVRPDDPFAVGVGETWYAKPEGRYLLISPSEETPQEPGDARPDELDVALAIERVNVVTTLGIRSVVTSWAGQRTFAPDRTLVVGERAPGLAVVAGQGGSGIETAPAAAALAAAVLVDRSMPDDLRRHGVQAAAYSPERLL
ncbi:FAD-dependent oxidoreductase [Actinomycetospora sp. OC33-EN08]|uniref:FAD-dependent oxidoreductase n=1 Tax=Actinomycetospora aurantiaca TaxID=3129233 RepID=A0ABU8MWI2_9PSEU